MTTINRTDLIQVTAHVCGTVLLTLSMSGASTINDVFRHVRESAPKDVGMLTVKLRNRTQGWTRQHNLVFRQPKLSASPHHPASSSSEYPSLFA